MGSKPNNRYYLAYTDTILTLLAVNQCGGNTPKHGFQCGGFPSRSSRKSEDVKPGSIESVSLSGHIREPGII